MSDSTEPSEPVEGAAAVAASSGPGWSEEGLAAMFLRLLGVYFTALGVIYAVNAVVRVFALFVAARKFDMDFALSDDWRLLIYPIAYFVVGIYLLIGGQWVYDKLLCPIRRGREDDSAAPESSPADA